VLYVFTVREKDANASQRATATSAGERGSGERFPNHLGALDDEGYVPNPQPPSGIGDHARLHRSDGNRTH
jgi:hypothetical protein